MSNCGSEGGAQEIHTAEISILISNMPKFFVLRQFKPAYSS